MSSINIILTSVSEIKGNVVKKIFKQYFDKENVTINLQQYAVNESHIPPQPVNSGMECAQERINVIRKKQKDILQNIDYIISIENHIIFVDNRYKDEVCVILEDISKNIIIKEKSINVSFPQIYYKSVCNRNDKETNYEFQGYAKTLGEVLKEICDSDIDPKNWMKKVSNIDREYQIETALTKILDKLMLYRCIKKIENFPIQGVSFMDLNEIWKDYKYFNILIRLLKEKYVNSNITHIVGLESRGFIIGSALAILLEIGFIPIRKRGKLGGEVYSENYVKEYGSDTIEIRKDILRKGDNVLIIDDILATGGTLYAACKLVEKCNAKIVECCVLFDIPFFRKKVQELLKNYKYSVLL